MKEVIQLDVFESRQARDEGMDRALTKANNQSSNWGNDAYELLKKYLKHHPGKFQCEDVRSFAAVEDFPLPENSRSWGAIFNRAITEGLINKVGIGPVKNKKAHRANANIYFNDLKRTA
jgi:hypothetical protein